METSRQYINKSGFTLAEVLITLGIIGIVAAMTIPTLMNKTRDAEFKSGYKKAFSMASQAWLTVISNGDATTMATNTDGAANVNCFNLFKAQFGVVRDCNAGNNSDCWTKDKDLNLPYSDARAFVDKSGMSWSMPCHPTSTDCGLDIFWVDVNGMKKPNQMGRDQFPMVLSTADGSYPGDPIKIIPYPDITTSATSQCATVPCYFTSWLNGAK